MIAMIVSGARALRAVVATCLKTSNLSGQQPTIKHASAQMHRYPTGIANAMNSVADGVTLRWRLSPKQRRRQRQAGCRSLLADSRGLVLL